MAPPSCLPKNQSFEAIPADRNMRRIILCFDDARFVNHSDTPNVATDYAQDPYGLDVALRDIATGEEVCWDYSTSIGSPGWSLACQCGSAKCRGIVRCWGELAPADRERLRTIALAYLRQKAVSS